jgi:hypothetical protein
MRRCFFALLMVVLAAAALDAEPALWLDPVAVYGYPGQTAGWGFTIENDSGYLVVTGTNFTPNDPAHVGRGTYEDFFLAYNFIVVGPTPAEQVTQVYDAASHLGLGAYSIDPGAPFGSIAGGMVVTYDLYSADPTMTSAYTVTPGLILRAGTSVNVVPEPAAFWLAGAAFAAAGLRARRRATSAALPGSSPRAAARA